KYQFEKDGQKYLVKRSTGSGNVELITTSQARRLVNASQVLLLILLRPIEYSNKKLVPRADKVMVNTLKWIYKVKLDELGGFLKNKARLAARGYRQEDRIDFEDSFALVARLDAI
ncbi:retrovirus-related pol polyprotein from transposon TNT 1-94, partial [Tanacetum coccineum]